VATRGGYGSGQRRWRRSRRGRRSLGTRSEAGSNALESFLEALPVVAVDRDVAALAGWMGAYARKNGATIPLADLLIADSEQG
jgi:predicted nucleic acid-binding protein